MRSNRPFYTADLPAPDCPPEYRLLAAILEEAVRTASQTDVMRLRNGRFEISQTKSAEESRKKTKRDCQEARDWLLHGDLGDDKPFTFGWICRMLNSDPAMVRRNVRRLIEDRVFIFSARAKHKTDSTIAAWLYEAA